MKRSGITPLHLATCNSCTDIVKLLVAEGACLNYGASDVYSLTPLCSAVQKDSLGVIQDLLDAGGDVTFMSAKETTGGPLHYASTRTTIELLVAEGADVNEADAYGDTPVHWVPQRSSRDCGELLISKGARVNAANNQGRSPLHEAAEIGKVDTIRMLLEHGADVNLEDKDGRTAHEVFCNSAKIPFFFDKFQQKGLRHLTPSQKQLAKDLLEPTKNQQCVIS